MACSSSIAGPINICSIVITFFAAGLQEIREEMNMVLRKQVLFFFFERILHLINISQMNATILV